MKFALIFAMGSDMAQYFCVFDADDLPHAQSRAAEAYPSRWTYLLPYDERFLAHVRAYGKTPIEFGAHVVLAPANETIPGSR